MKSFLNIFEENKALLRLLELEKFLALPNHDELDVSRTFVSFFRQVKRYVSNFPTRRIQLFLEKPLSLPNPFARDMAVTILELSQRT